MVYCSRSSIVLVSVIYITSPSLLSLAIVLTAAGLGYGWPVPDCCWCCSLCCCWCSQSRRRAWAWHLRCWSHRADRRDPRVNLPLLFASTVLRPSFMPAGWLAGSLNFTFAIEPIRAVYSGPPIFLRCFLKLLWRCHQQRPSDRSDGADDRAVLPIRPLPQLTQFSALLPFQQRRLGESPVSLIRSAEDRVITGSWSCCRASGASIRRRVLPGAGFVGLRSLKRLSPRTVVDDSIAEFKQKSSEALDLQGVLPVARTQ